MNLRNKLIGAQAQYIINNNAAPSIVLFRLSALGDVVLWLSVVQEIQRFYPHAKLTWIISSNFFPLLKGLPGVSFIVLEKKSGVSNFFDNIKKLRRFKFDVLLAGQASLRANLLYPFIKAKLKIGFSGRYARDAHRFFVDYGVPYEKEHLLDRFMRFAAALGVPKKPPTWQIPIDDAVSLNIVPMLEGDRQQKSFSGPWIALALSASKTERNWSISKYLELMQQLRQNFAAKLIIVGGPSDDEVVAANILLQQFNRPCLNLTGKTNFKQLAVVLQQVDLLISPDTGALHIATAVGTPVVGLHAVIAASQTGSYLFQDLAVDCYAAAVKLCLNSSLENIPWGTRVHDKRAMSCIAVSMVMQKVTQALSANGFKDNK